MKLASGVVTLTLLLAGVTQARRAAPTQAGQLTPAEQRTVDMQLAAPKLDPRATVANFDLASTSLGDVVAAVAKAGGITVRYHSAVANLATPSIVKLDNVTIEAALHAILDPRALAFRATGSRAVFVYPDTPENRQKYTDSVRAFTIVNADVNALSMVLNRAITTITADELRPTIVSINSSRTLNVRATPDMMAKIAKIIADNDK